MALRPRPLAARLRRALRGIQLDVPHGWFQIGTHRTETGGHGELRHELRNALYWYLHASADGAHVPVRKPDRDHALEQALCAAVPHTHTRVTVGIIDSRDPGHCIADIGGVRVRLPGRPDLTAGDRAQFSMECVRPRLSPGFLLVDGSRGHGLTTEPTVRIYTRITDLASTVSVWGSALTILEGLSVPYRAKVTTTRPFHPRRDAMVVYLGPAAHGAAELFARRIAAHDHVAGEVSVFVRQLHPGVGIAWEPRHPSPKYAGHSFGEHRSAVVADALLDLRTEDSVPLEAAVAEALIAAGIDPARPWRTLDPTKGDSLHS